MNMLEKRKLDSILKRHFLVHPHLLKRNKYLEDIGLTKLEKLEMLNYVEREFNIQLSEQDERRIKTLDDTLNILHQYLQISA